MDSKAKRRFSPILPAIALFLAWEAATALAWQTTPESQDAAQALPVIHAKAATFQGLTPGSTTAAEVQSLWGAPIEEVEDGDRSVRVFARQPFRQVQVKLQGDVVSSIQVRLVEPLDPAELANKLRLSEFRPVVVRDAVGLPLGQAFPERGVLFSYLPGEPEPRVPQLLLETIDPQSFLLRAESLLHGPYRANLADLKYVISEAPTSADAHRLAAEIYLAVGHEQKALVSAQAAAKHSGDGPQGRIIVAKCLAQLGEYSKAGELVAPIAGDSSVSPLVQAQAALELGNLLSRGPERDYKRAVALHLQASKLAEALNRDADAETKRRAQDILIDAHLGAARDIGWGNWKQKESAVPKWIQKADQFAIEQTLDEQLQLERRLRIIEAALDAHAGFQPAVQATRFLDTAEKIAAELAAAHDDPLWRQRIDWQVGAAYAHAVRLAHHRNDVETGLKYARTARKRLEQAARSREPSQRAKFLLGRLYFDTGALYAVHKEDHETAVDWYARATALLTPPPDAELADAGQIGEALVSMGVSYWEVDLKQKSIELTTQGVGLLETAVERGHLQGTVLEVPYNNLATMHTKLGDEAKANAYLQMARQSGATQKR